jgi:hypothetical protein
MFNCTFFLIDLVQTVISVFASQELIILTFFGGKQRKRGD